MDLLSSRRGRRLLFAALYFCEGAPIGFIWWYVQTRLRAAGVPLDEITATMSHIALPWALKFLWAPFVDGLRGGRWGLRAWILAAQAVMAATLLPLAFIESTSWLAACSGLLVVHAVAAATQDAAIDALCIRSVPAAERGGVNGWMQAGMLVARSAFGGAALLVAERVGDAPVVLALVACLAAAALLVLLVREPGGQASRQRLADVFATLAGALASRRLWVGLLFAVTSGAAFEGVGGVLGAFLVDRGYTEGFVGTLRAVPTTGAMLIGALAGGLLSDRLGRVRSVVVFQIALVALIALLAARDLALPPGPTLIALVVVIHIAIGLFTASSYALFMDLSDPRAGATQFSAYMGATNLCEAWAVYAVGRIVLAGGAESGYPFAFLGLAAASALALVVLPFMTGRRREPADQGIV